MPPQVVALPMADLGPGIKIDCLWRDQQYHQCKILDRRKKQNSEAYEYYVHYLQFNRRLDEWVSDDRFDLSTLQADDEIVIPQPVPEPEDTPKVERKITRNMKRRFEETNPADKNSDAPSAPAPEKEHEEHTKVKNFQKVLLGAYEIDTWYFSPYPEDFSGVNMLFVCEFCLKYMKKARSLENHKRSCPLRSPPGVEIYKADNLALYEVDGKDNKVYCQNLCLLAKLFLDHKTLYFDVDPFLFYVLTECDAFGSHIVGYFSKEKSSPEEYNLACIMTLPPHQRKGYGKLLIAFAYEISKAESKAGTPERPLSDLGQLSFRSYWKHVLLEVLGKHQGGHISVADLSFMTAIKPEDIVTTFKSLDLVQYINGQHVISVSRDMIEQNAATNGNSCVQIDGSKLRMTLSSRQDDTLSE